MTKPWGTLILGLWMGAFYSPFTWAGEAKIGKALGEKGLNLTSKETAKLSDDDALKVITEGRGKMPAAGKGLSKQEQKDLLGYVRSLAK